MNASPNSGESNDPLPDLRFAVLERVPEGGIPHPERAAALVIELFELFLPLAVGRPEFEARRLAMKTRVPFRIVDAPPPAGAGP